MQLHKCYRFRLEPTASQQQTFRQWAGCRRWIWNWALEQKHKAVALTGPEVSRWHLQAQLPLLKRQPETAFLKECHSQALQETLRDVDRAFTNFFEKRARYPKRKSRKWTVHAFRISQQVRVEGSAVRIPKIGLVKARLHRDMLGTIKSATVKQAATGHWFITFVCHFEQATNAPTVNCPAGIDSGLETFATFDDGEKVVPPKFYRKQEKQLKRCQRRVSRCQKGSQRRTKARKRLAIVHAKVRDQRQDWLQKLSLNIVSCHDTICIEDLCLTGLARTKRRGHAKSWSDAAHGEFRRMLEYKGLWYGCQVVKVSRFFPSSKLCSICGHRADLSLSDRHWFCAGCGTDHDRDTNAALNILSEGLRNLVAGHANKQNAR